MYFSFSITSLSISWIYKSGFPKLSPIFIATASQVETSPCGALHNVTLARLWTQDEIKQVRQKTSELSGAYKPPSISASNAANQFGPRSKRRNS
jgi:hypothetical protein